MILADKFTCEVPVVGNTFLECNLPQDGILDWLTAIGTLASAGIALLVAIYSFRQIKKSAAEADKSASQLSFKKAAKQVTKAFNDVADGGQDVSRHSVHRVTNAIRRLEFVDYKDELWGDQLIFVLHEANVDIIQRLYDWSTSRADDQSHSDIWGSDSRKRKNILIDLSIEISSILNKLQMINGEKKKLAMVSSLRRHAKEQSKILETTKPQWGDNK